MPPRSGRRGWASRGVSSVIGGMIVLAIIFTTVIPMISFLSQMSSDLENAAIGRRILDEAKRREDIQSSVYQDFSDGGKIKVWIRNAGTIPITILRIWVIDRSNPDPDNNTPISVDETLPPYSNPLIVDTGITPSVGNIYDIIVFTERGNAVVPDGSPLTGQSTTSPLNVTSFPYTLTVTLLEMRPNRNYHLTLEGNIPGGRITYSYKPVAPNSSVSFAFGVNPGNYTLTAEDSIGSFTEQVSFSVPDVLHITIRVPSEPDTADVVLFAAIPGAVRRGSEFYVRAFVVNTGTVSICSMDLTITVSGPGFSLDPPPAQTQSLWPACIDPGEASAPVYWIIDASSSKKKTGTITIDFSGEDPDGNIVSDSLSQEVRTVP